MPLVVSVLEGCQKRCAMVSFSSIALCVGAKVFHVVVVSEIPNSRTSLVAFGGEIVYLVLR
jgi:hypothetical protein